MRVLQSVTLLALLTALLPVMGVLSPNPEPASASHLTEISAGGMHTCALRWTGGVKCWGRNDSGQLGNGTITTAEVRPVDPVGLATGVAQISSGATHTCAVTTGGGVKCWGSWPGLGTGVSSNSSVPVDVPGLTSGVASVSAGFDSTCVVTTSGGVKCWGEGMLSATPTDVSGVTSGIAAVSAGFRFACALTTGGGVRCWGYNNDGQIGDNGACGSICATAQDVSGLSSGVLDIQAGESHACALMSARGIKCWGYNEGGNLGDGTTTNRPTPVDVVGLTSGVAQVSAENGIHTCAIMQSDGSAKCWGFNYFGQLGGGTSGFVVQPTPVNVIYDGAGLSAISAGGIHTCALALDGAVICWGSDLYNQLGSDTDGDGCTDGAETGSSASSGGRRDPFNPWDFYDVNGDGSINVLNDILGVAGAFGMSNGPNYSTAKDRSPPSSAAQAPDPSLREPWDMGPPDGAINVVTDILGVARQFGHACA